ncbi:hypothetical protein GCM10025859_59730 [Alicyclobacillus fastidiosus]|nr:hypothetical protein GCM10025859_01950 [Alicyclobacillus fastidiosus]GMA65533.1 hypothetical protein GCM10025859_59730 [Alicyclobacillus fastidiosus]
MIPVMQRQNVLNVNIEKQMHSSGWLSNKNPLCGGNTMTQYSFYATVRDASTHRYPTYTFIEAGTDQEATHKC